MVASLYTLPLMVLKSSASASDADRTANIASVVAEYFTQPGFCRVCSPHRNKKLINRRPMTRATFNRSQRILEIDIQDEANYYHHGQCDKQYDDDVHADCHR